MLLSPKHSSTFAGLLRLVAGWIAAILLMQGFAACYERALGPSHHHVPQRAVNLWSHGHTHGAEERHHHLADDSSVQTSASNAAAEDAWDAAASALVMAFALLSVSRVLRIAAAGRHVWRAAISWACLTGFVVPPLKPPRKQ
jgi:hypothetical protein